MVPIKLEDDGKMIQKEPEESMQTKAEFTNFTHQEFSDDKRKFFAKYAFMRMATKNFSCWRAVVKSKSKKCAKYYFSIFGEQKLDLYLKDLNLQDLYSKDLYLKDLYLKDLYSKDLSS